MTYSIEAVHHIYDDDNGEFISIGQSSDFPGNVMLFTKPPGDKYFGEIRLDLPNEQMYLIAQAILKACEEAKQKE